MPKVELVFDVYCSNCGDVLVTEAIEADTEDAVWVYNIYVESCTGCDGKQEKEGD